MKLSTPGRLGLSACLVVALAGCGSGTGTPGGGGVVEGGTFTLGLSSDPGNLDPQLGAGTSLFTVTQFAYDPLVSVDGTTGKIGSQLATEWAVDGTTVTLTLGEGITCA